MMPITNKKKYGKLAENEMVVSRVPYNNKYLTYTQYYVYPHKSTIYNKRLTTAIKNPNIKHFVPQFAFAYPGRETRYIANFIYAMYKIYPNVPYTFTVITDINDEFMISKHIGLKQALQTIPKTDIVFYQVPNINANRESYVAALNKIGMMPLNTNMVGQEDYTVFTIMSKTLYNEISGWRNIIQK